MDIDYSVEITQDNSLVGVGEIVGLVLAGIVLVAMLGTLVAAGLPLAVAMIGVGVGLAAAMALTAFYEMNSMTPALAPHARPGRRHRLRPLHRQPPPQPTAAGHGPQGSIARAVGTSGSAVLFAGTTVVIALVALVLSGIPLLAQMGLVAAGTVAVAVLVALTLPLPSFASWARGRLASWMASGRIHHPGRGLDPRRHRGPARGRSTAVGMSGSSPADPG